MFRLKFYFLLALIIFVSCPMNLHAKKAKIHPRNIKLIKLGLMPNVPKYHPEIPRIMPNIALNLYKSNKALFVLISHSNRDLIYGGLHLTEGKVVKINPNALPVKKGQVLVLY